MVPIEGNDAIGSRSNYSVTLLVAGAGCQRPLAARTTPKLGAANFSLGPGGRLNRDTSPPSSAMKMDAMEMSR
jgi:hypothetical protein